MSVSALATNAHLTAYLHHPSHREILNQVISDHVADYDRYFKGIGQDRLDSGLSVDSDTYNEYSQQAADAVLKLLDRGAPKLPYRFEFHRLTTSEIDLGSYVVALTCPPKTSAFQS